MTVRSRLLKKDPGSDIELWHHYDTATDETCIETRQDCNALLDANKASANMPGIKHAGIKKEWWRVANIPNIVIEKWRQELGVNVFDPNDAKKVKQFLSDPDYRFLRTSPGRI